MFNPEQTALEGVLLSRAGRVREAEQKLQLLVQHDPQPTARILLASLLPPIYQSMHELLHWRNRLESAIRQLLDDNIRQDLDRSFAVPEFMAQYHGLNDRQLQQWRANLYNAPQNDQWSKRRPRPADGKIRVGLVSKYFKDHTIGRLNEGLVAKLPRSDFHVSVLAVGDARDDIGDLFRQHADNYIGLPEQVSALPEVRRIIAGLNLDILYYADLGMEPITYTLAQSRLAPIQCVTWGHPVTTGLPQMDYFISAEGLEPDESQDQYTEKIVKLKDLAVCYRRPVLAGPPGGRDRLGLPLDAHLYGCPQSLYKMHPEFDELLAAILHSDPRGILVLLEGHYKDWQKWLLERFSRSLGDAARRVRFIGRQDHQGFLRLNALCDVLLDPIHFGGGNTTYEALSLGTPVVTLPSNMLRGRLAYKMYLTMGYTDCVARDKQDFVRIAVHLGTNKDARRLASQKILQSCGVLFDNPAGIQQLAEFWKSVVNS
jgi:protein O-GlcNAc transferase